ncbi:hypothetical protein KP509_1Z322800 [Ceratopteris richardii]|nr:hypothetical protein KP509_1Z322800 [Ceratopteris richardii]KAH6554591.1 hypothetical protein KP509_1Z322800 [Ceratopteris richardii]
MALGLFRTIAAVGRNMVISNTFGTFILVVVFSCGGFVLSRDNIPSWWSWGYWVSPLMYGQNAIAVNEFTAPRWDIPNNDTKIDADTVGTAILKTRGFFTSSEWFWIGIGGLSAFVVLFYVLFTIALIYLNPLSKPQTLLSPEIIEEKHANRTGETRRTASTQQMKSHESASLTQKDSKGIQFEGSHSGSETSIGCQRFSSIVNQTEQADAEAAYVYQKTGMILPFKPLSLAFDNINYFVDMPAEMKEHGVQENRLQLLQDVSGAFRPGVLTALVGVSGAGKTTLMDVLAGRKTGGYIEGTISISGYPKRQSSFARISGYCEQNDIHSPNVTVHESLLYSAWLRLSQEISKHTRMLFIEEVMELVELSSIKGALVGLPGVNGLSTEQRKRLTIAVELVANPSIIFMDEPTSGLDARAAAIVMRTVRNTVDTGRTVVCTIHQPSIDIFEAFDELILMKLGGQVIYSGPLGHHSCDLIEYFESIPGVPKIKEGQNPAAWMLEISSPLVEQKLGINFADIFQKSFIYK